MTISSGGRPVRRASKKSLLLVLQSRYLRPILHRFGLDLLLLPRVSWSVGFHDSIVIFGRLGLLSIDLQLRHPAHPSYS